MEDKKHHKNRNLDQHIDGKFEVADGEGSKWEGQQMSVNSDPIQDAGTGTQYVLRFFEYAMNPQYKGKWINKQEIFNSHAQQIKMQLWADGLIPNEDISPRVVIEKKVARYKIAVLCEPRSLHGMKETILDRSKTVQDIIQNGTRRNSK